LKEAKHSTEPLQKAQAAIFWQERRVSISTWTEAMVAIIHMRAWTTLRAKAETPIVLSRGLDTTVSLLLLVLRAAMSYWVKIALWTKGISQLLSRRTISRTWRGKDWSKFDMLIMLSIPMPGGILMAIKTIKA
jgi:hypothetical protein